MKVRVQLTTPDDVKAVDVRAEECPALDCFCATRQIIRSAAGMSGASSRTTNEWVCGRREQTGCPPEERRVPNVKRRRTRGVWREIP